LSTITDVFKTEKFEDQFKIGSYYLDLYFSEYKIVIECDENGHVDRKPCDEKERMDFVNKELNIDDSHWIRFNPDDHNFDISKVIGKIYRKIDQIKEIKLKEEYSKMKKKVEFKKCFKCKIKKKFTTEFFDTCGTGLSNL
jgi:very-short-patch-repair endonuclease